MSSRISLSRDLGKPEDPRLTAGRLADAFALRAPDHDRSGKLPRENFRALGEVGLLSLSIPAEAGGFGGGLAIAADVIGIIARGEPAPVSSPTSST